MKIDGSTINITTNGEALAVYSGDDYDQVTITNSNVYVENYSIGGVIAFNCHGNAVISNSRIVGKSSSGNRYPLIQLGYVNGSEIRDSVIDITASDSSETIGVKTFSSSSIRNSKITSSGTGIQGGTLTVTNSTISAVGIGISSGIGIPSSDIAISDSSISGGTFGIMKWTRIMRQVYKQ